MLVPLLRDLWVLMAELATAPENRHKLEAGTTAVTQAMVDRLESEIDALDERFDPPKEFIVPGGNVASAWLDLARTVVRRAERHSLHGGACAVARRAVPQPAVGPAVDDGALAGRGGRLDPAGARRRRRRPDLTAMTTSSALTGGVATFNPTPSIERSHDVVVSVGRSVPSTADVVGVPVGTKGAVPRQLGLDRATLAEFGFDAKVGQTLVVPRRDGATLAAVGIGDPADLTPATLRDAAAAFARAAAKHGALATTLADVAPGVAPDVAAQAIVEGVLLARYRYGALKRDTPAAGLRELTLVVTAPRTGGGGARRRTGPRRRRRGAAGTRPRQHPAGPPDCDAAWPTSPASSARRRSSRSRCSTPTRCASSAAAACSASTPAAPSHRA